MNYEDLENFNFLLSFVSLYVVISIFRGVPGQYQLLTI